MDRDLGQQIREAQNEIYQADESKHPWLQTRKASDPFEPEWEPYVDAAASQIWKRIVMLNGGPADAPISPAVHGIISGEIRKLVNELTHDWY